MAKRFEPHRRLLETLIGSNLYGASDACVRELLQNAWDAIQLRNLNFDDQGGRIIVRYSESGGWFEIVDDGIGMDQKTIEKSFFEVGQDKLAVLEITKPASQIGYFGIGVLSVFLLADRFEVFTKSIASDGSGIQFCVADIDEPVEFVPFEQSSPGTRIRVYPREGEDFAVGSLPDVVASYARHVPGITLHSIDNNIQQTVTDSWETAKLLNVREVEGIAGVRAGRIGFLPALRENSGTLENEITLCNVGFLVEKDVADLVSSNTFGIGGEIDLESSTVNIGMSRERIQRDHRWLELGAQLQAFFVQAAVAELESGELKPTQVLDSETTKRNILLWYHFMPPEPPFSELYETLDHRVYETVPFEQAERYATSLKKLVQENHMQGKLYFRQKGHPTERQERIDDDGLPIRFYQEVRDSVRTSALRAKGFSVIELNVHQVNVKTQNTVQTLQMPEQPLVQKCLQKRGIELCDIVNAPESDMDMRGIEKLPILRSALTMAGGLTFAAVPDSKRRVISDQTGMRYINLNNPAVQGLLRLIPDATSNPLKHRLLEAYLRLEDFKLSDAREILIELLNRDDLELLATVEMAPLTKEHIGRRIREILGEMES